MSRLWVLDIDDTLYLERDYVRSGFRAVGTWAAGELGVDGIAELAWQLFLEGRRGSTITDAFDKLGRPLSGGEVRAAIAVYREHRPDISLLGDAREFLDALPAGAPIGIVTDGPSASQRAKIAALGLDLRPACIVVTSERGPEWHKPSTLAFAHVQSELGVRASDCVYVADNPRKDFTGPHSLGWGTVRMTRPNGLHASVASVRGEVDREVVSFRALFPNL